MKVLVRRDRKRLDIDKILTRTEVFSRAEVREVMLAASQGYLKDDKLFDAMRCNRSYWELGHTEVLEAWRGDLYWDNLQVAMANDMRRTDWNQVNFGYEQPSLFD